MDNTIYVVEFHTGMYDSALKTPMCAFYLEDDAINYVERVNSKLKEQNLLWKDLSRENEIFSFEAKEYSVDYIGAEAMYYSLGIRGLDKIR